MAPTESPTPPPGFTQEQLDYIDARIRQIVNVFLMLEVAPLVTDTATEFLRRWAAGLPESFADRLEGNLHENHPPCEN
jgi:hypothetical protein